MTSDLHVDSLGVQMSRQIISSETLTDLPLTKWAESQNLTPAPPTAPLATALAAPEGNREPLAKPRPSQEPLSEIPSKEPQILTVSQVNQAIRAQLEGQFNLIWIKGEISNFKAHSSGHWYFSLKDSKAQISGVMFRGFNSRLKFHPEDGLEVLVRGRITVYEPRGNYQVFCELMEPVGAGALQKAFEQLKRKLSQEGLFDAARKRALPAFPKHLVIVTSPTGAAIRDMLNILARRFRLLDITLIPTVVQGDQAPPLIVKAIETAARLPGADVLIVGRGGGSVEDLWAFNDERVARAIAACPIPVISAVGHEIDFTIADFVADLRAPTPSAAAELVVKDSEELLNRLQGLSLTLNQHLGKRLQVFRHQLGQASLRLIDPRRRISDYIFRLDELVERAQNAIRGLSHSKSLILKGLRARLATPQFLIDRKRLQLQKQEEGLNRTIDKFLSKQRETVQLQAGLLDSLSPLKVLERGYSVTRTARGKVLRSVDGIEMDSKIDIWLSQGTIHATVNKVTTKQERTHGI